MRKNFMLSLTAMAALPMAGFADATWSVPADNSSITDWAKVEDTDLSSSSTEQIIGIGAGISQNLTLVKGKYTVTVAKLSNAEFAIRVGDKTYSSGEQFTLTDETNTVTLEVTTKDTSKQFTVGGIEIILDFNFATAKTALTNSLTDAVAALPATEAERDFWQKEIATEQAGIKTRIDALEGLNGGNKTAYDKYVAEGLYKETSNIQAAINALSADIQKANNYREAYEEVLAAFAGMDTQLTSLKNKVDVDAETGAVTGTATKFAQGTYAAEVKKLKATIKDFKESFTYETKNIFDNKTKQDWLDAVTDAETEIAALSTNINNADLDAAAFDAVKTAIQTATDNYYLHKTALEFGGNADYATLSKKALDKLAAAYRPIVEQKDITCSLDYRNDKDANLQIIAQAETKMSGVETTFVGYYNTVKAHFVTVNGYAESVEAYKKAIADDKLTVDAQYVTTAETAINTAKGVLEEAMKAVSDETTQEEFEAAMPTYTDLQAAVEVLELNVLLASAQSYYNTAKEAVDGMVEGKYKEAAYWTIQTTDFEDKILGHDAIDLNTPNRDQIKQDIKLYYFKNRTTTPNAESGYIYEYLTNATASFKKYQDVTAYIKTWTKKYDAVAAFAKNPSVPFVDTTTGNTTTYGAALADAMDDIKDSQGALDDAVDTQITGVAHAYAMLNNLIVLGENYPAIFSATVEGYTAAKNQHELPQTITSAQSLAVEVKAKADAVIANLRTAYNTYNGKAAAYGKRYDEIWGGDEATADATKDNFWGIRKRYYNVAGVNANGDYTAVATADNATYDVAIANITTLKEHRNTFVAIDEAIKTLNANAEQIKAAFDANNTAYTEFVASCGTARTKAGEINTKNTDGNRTVEFTALYDGVIASLDALEALLEPSKTAETFKADRDKTETGFQATLDGINADITAHIAAAEASAANYEAKEDLLKQIEKDLYEVDKTTPITNAALAIINLKSNAGHTHFVGVINQLATDITTLKTDVLTAYGKGEASKTKETLKGRITRIKNDVEKALTDCTANDENYDKLTETGKKVEELYIKIYYKISDTDQTSKKQEWLDDLAAIETVSQEAIDKSFAAGELSTAAKYQEYDKKYSDRKAAIEQVNADWIDPSGYLDRVRAANEAEFEDLKAAYNDAVEVYLKAIAGLKPFLDYKGDDQRWNEDVAEHNAKIFDAKKALDGAYAAATEAYDNMSERNRALTPETVENAEYFDGSDWYSSTKDAQGVLQEDGLIYDARVAISNVYAKAIKALNSDTKTHLQSAIKTVEDDVDNTIGAIDTSLYAIYQGDGVKTAREKFFVKVDEALDKVTKLLDSEQLAVDYLNSKGTDEEDYDKQIEAIKTTTLPNALNALAEAQYNDWIADKNAKHTELYDAAYEGADKGLFKLYADIATKGYQAAFEAAEAALNENLSQLGEDYTPTYGSTEMDDLYSYFIDFKSNNGYKEFKNAIGTYKDSEAAYEKFIKGTEAAAGDTYINEVQRIIDNEAKTYAPDFIVAADTIAGVQARLDALVADANTFRATYGMATHYPTLLSQLRTVKAAAKGLMADINQAEYDELVFQLANLKSDYNQALIEGNKESDAMNVYHEKILGYETALTLANFDMSDTKKDAEEETAPAVVPFHTYDKLLAIQDSIIADRNELAGVRVDGIYKALVANLNGLTDRYKTMAENYAKLYTYQQNAIALKADKSGELQASVDASNANHWILIEEKSLKDRIDSWTDYLDDMEPEVATALDVHDTDAAARQRLQTELEDCQTYVENMLENKLFKLNDAQSNWEYSYYKSNYDSFVNANADIYSDPQSDGQRKNENSKLTNIGLHNENIKYFERENYNDEVWLRYYFDGSDLNNEEYTCVNTALSTIERLLNNANILNKDTYSAECSDLRRKAQAAWNFFSYIYGNGYTYVDINGDRIIDDGGNYVRKYYTHKEFVDEVVPVVIERIELILEEAATLEADINANTYVPGDLSGDKKVSLADFATLQSIILSKPEVDDEVQKAAADLNKDGFVDISDLMLLVRQILTPTAPAPARVRVAIPHATTNDAVSVIVEGEGVHQRIGIMLDAEQAYAGCQMDITLPEGVTLAEETTGEMAGALSLLSNDLENGSHRILLSSVEGLTMATGNGALLWLDVNVDHNYNGEGIGLSNVLFANSFGRAFELSVAAGETTGLSNVSMTQEVKEKIYNVGGILMDGLKRGVNIIRGNDGSSKKIIVK